jgi:hypothetical protein
MKPFEGLIITDGYSRQNTLQLSQEKLQKGTADEVVTGVKFDSQKPPMDLIPYEALEEVARVLAAGEQKYGTANWAKGIEMRRLLSAALRHIGQFNSGEDMDQETKTLHIANAATNLLFAIWMYKHRPDLDNRWAKELK